MQEPDTTNNVEIEEAVIKDTLYKKQADGWRKSTYILAVILVCFMVTYAVNLQLRSNVLKNQDDTLKKLDEQQVDIKHSLQILEDASGPDAQQTRTAQLQQLLMLVDCNNRLANKDGVQAIIDALASDGLIKPFTVPYPICGDK